MTDSKDMSKEIISSTGSMGVDTRSDSRVYWNVKQPMRSLNRTQRGFERLGEATKIKPERKYQFNFQDKANRRDVMRFVANTEVAQGLINPQNPFSDNVEVAFPIGEGDWYISLGKNGQERKTILTMEELIQETAVPTKPKYPAEIVNRVLSEGYGFQTDLSSDDIKQQVLGLWEDTFGWSADEVDNLAKRLDDQENQNQKNVWFSALKKVTPEGVKVVAAGMAEKITFTRSNGKPIDLVELTEWSSDPKSRGNGYMPAVVSQLAAQVLDSYAGASEDRDVMLIAECNIGSFAHKTGYSAGLTVPERVVPQILKQNVDVNGQKSDFAFMYVSPASLARNYPPDVVKQILQNTQPVQK